jgi:hypothetical protein
VIHPRLKHYRKSKITTICNIVVKDAQMEEDATKVTCQRCIINMWKKGIVVLALPYKLRDWNMEDSMQFQAMEGDANYWGDTLKPKEDDIPKTN